MPQTEVCATAGLMYQMLLHALIELILFSIT